MLVPMAVVAPSQPVRNNSLFQVFTKLAADLPKQPVEGEVWLMVYDFKALTQQPGIEWFVNLGTQKSSSCSMFMHGNSRNLFPIPRFHA